MSSNKQNLHLIKGEQMLLYYNDKREALGIQPRDSFLNSSNAKVVVWAFVFTNKKKLLLHRRKDNARDNRGLWDKSVGGHVERSDLESAKAIARELAEELYTDECIGNKEENYLLTQNIVKNTKYLGEWDNSIKKLYADEHFFKFYRVNYAFSKNLIESYRILPNGKKVKIHFFADVFVFVAPKNFCLDNLLNSDYVLLGLEEIKETVKNGYFRSSNVKCELTPDMNYIINSPIWTDLENFSNSIVE